jgi:lipopolysaccharide biosynthesis glycosyltransferase
LIIDDIEGYIDPAKEKFRVLSLNDLNIPNLRDFCFKYTIVELATAVKPYAFKYLLDTTQINKILYLDPDIMVMNSLENLYRTLDTSDIILTPHLDKDYPDDDLWPADYHIMMSGIFNLGFIGVRRSENTDRFLQWWQHKLYDKCTTDFSTGYFVDQKFVEYAFVLFPNISVISDTGYNVAYWNLHSRAIKYRDNDWLCNDGKLFFYHFSDFKPERPDSIASRQSRHHFADMPDLRKLFSSYAGLLIENGYTQSKNWPYTYNKFTTRRELQHVLMRSFRGYATRINIKTFLSFSKYPNYLRTVSKQVISFVKNSLK